MKTYKQYINESIRDMMTPKSKEDIDKVIDNFFKNNPDIKIFNWKKFGFDFISYQVKSSFYSFVFLAPDDIYWYLFIWKDGTLELRTSHFQEKGVRFKTNDDIEWYLGTKYKPINESIRDKMIPKSKEDIEKVLGDLPLGKRIYLGNRYNLYTKEEIDDIIKGMSVRDKFIQGNRYGLKIVVNDAMKYRKSFDDVKVGDWLTQKDKYMMYQIKEKVSFDGPQEYYDYMRDHSWLHKFDYSSTEKFVEKTLLRGEIRHVDCVVVSKGNRYLMLYDDNVGVFPYMEKEEKDKCDLPDNRERIEQMKNNESVRDMMTPKSKEDLESSLNKIPSVKDRLYLAGRLGIKYNIMNNSYTVSPNELLRISSEKHLLDGVKEAVERGSHKSYALRLCSEYGFYDGVEWLLKNGANPYSNDSEAFKISKNNPSISRLIGQYRKNTVPYNESIRDKMTPKCMDEISKVLVGMMNKDKYRGYFDPREWGLTLVDYDPTGGLNDFCLLTFKSDDGRMWQITIDERGYFPLIVREKKRGVAGIACREYSCVDEYLTKKGLVKRDK